MNPKLNDEIGYQLLVVRSNQGKGQRRELLGWGFGPLLNWGRAVPLLPILLLPRFLTSPPCTL